MKTIKFRAWDKKNKTMLYQNDNAWMFMPSGNFYKMEQAGTDMKLQAELTPMQFTGLLDKNGKEIYEGDIVTFHAFTFNGSETEYEGKGIIKYRPDGLCFVIEEKNDFDWMVRDTSQFGEACFEIIGNIYENPELLPTNI